MDKYLVSTIMLDYEAENIQKLIVNRGWNEKTEFNKILEVYNFIRDEIKFGYNIDDRIPASKVLLDGYGQCNTKGTLFMAILRALRVPCRIHGFTINKRLQKGPMSGFVYLLAPENVVHSWVEVLYEGTWHDLEGLIIDKMYLNSLQKKFNKCSGSFCGYGVAVKDFANLAVDWNGNSTFIQKEGINQDFGIYDTPDAFFAEHSQQLNPIKNFVFRNVGRHLMNRNVNKLRTSL